MGYKKNREMKVYGLRGYNYKSIPMIRLQGNWLSELGFTEGSSINVECNGGQLIITLLDDKCMINDNGPGINSEQK